MRALNSHIIIQWFYSNERLERVVSMFGLTITFRLMSFVLIIFSLAVLVYLNYKNAYEHWNEQRLALNKEVGFFHYVHAPLIQFQDMSHFHHLF